MKPRKPTMNEDIKEFNIYILTRQGKLKQIFWINSTADYNHKDYNLHHFIEKSSYNKNKTWYEEHGIKQFLIYVPIFLHEQIHNQAVKNLSDKEFVKRFKISRWKLVFNKKYSKY